MHPDFLAQSFALLCEAQTELQTALASLGGKPSRGFQDNYYNLSAAHINRAAEAFVFLRRAGRTDASKLLIRPTIEAMIKLEAVKKEAPLLFRIAFSERLKDKTWYVRAAKRTNTPYDDLAEQKAWDEAKKSLTVQFHPAPLDERGIDLRALATKIDTVNSVMENYYDSHYLMYCSYTHAALSSLTGLHNELSDPEDSITMVLCVFCALDAIVPLGATAPHLDALRQRRAGLYATP